MPKATADYKIFFEKLNSGTLPRVLLFDGEEEYIKDSALAQLRAKVLPEGTLQEMNEEKLTETASAGEIADACEMLPFLSPKRLILVRDSALVMKRPGEASGVEEDEESGEKEERGSHRSARSGEDGEDEVGRLLRLISAMPETAVLVFFCRGKSNRTKKIPTRIKSLGGCFEFAPLSPEEKSLWLSRELKVSNKTMSRKTAELFLSETDPLILPTLQELRKLTAYVGERMTIEEEDVRALVAQSVDDRLYKMFDLLVDGENEAAMEIVRNLLVMKGMKPIQIFIPLARRIRQIYDCKVLRGKGVPESETAKISGVNERALWAYEKQARAFSTEQLRNTLELSVRLDYEFKSGLISDENALNELLMVLLNRKKGQKKGTALP